MTLRSFGHTGLLLGRGPFSASNGLSYQMSKMERHADVTDWGHSMQVSCETRRSLRGKLSGTSSNCIRNNWIENRDCLTIEAVPIPLAGVAAVGASVSSFIWVASRSIPASGLSFCRFTLRSSSSEWSEMQMGSGSLFISGLTLGFLLSEYEGHFTLPLTPFTALGLAESLCCFGLKKSKTVLGALHQSGLSGAVAHNNSTHETGSSQKLA